MNKLSLISATLSFYSYYVFATLDHKDTGVITFEVRMSRQKEKNTQEIKVLQNVESS